MKYLTKKTYWPILYTFDSIGKLLFKNKKEIPKKLRKALFIRLEHIGDVIMATPAFESFKKNNPGCEVHVLCRTLTKPLLENNPFVDKIITYDAPWFIKRSGDKQKKLRELVKELRKERYDVAFEMHGDPRNNYIAYKTGAYSVGYSCRGGGFFLSKTVEYNENLNMVRQNLNLIKNFAKISNSKPKIYSDNKSIEKAEEIMKEYGLKKKEFVIINPISGRKDKDMTKEEVEKAISGNRKYKIVITGSKDQRIANDIYKSAINLCGETDLLTLTEIVRKSRKVIAPDTGIIHIAKAVGTPFEAIYKTTDKNVWGY